MSAAKRFTQNPGRNAICYYRYSSEAQRDVSIVQQREAAHEYAEKHGYHIIKEYEDHAISGTRDDRPEFQLMLYEVEKLKPAYLILWKTDRLSRDRCDSVIAKKRLRDCGVKIEYVAETIPDDDEATQILMESIYEAMAASFIVSHRKNVMRGMNYNAENALYNGVKIFGYIGKVNQKYEIDENAAPIVLRIFTEYVEGVPMQKICNDLNNSGFKTNTGKEFTVNSLRHILTNRSYIGEYKFGDVIIPDGMPRLIEDSVFNEAQRKLQANKRGGKGAIKKMNANASIADYWLSDKLYCGVCGGPMQGMSGTSKGGNLYYYYSCNNHRKHKCDMKNMRKDFLEKIVVHVLNELIGDSVNRLLLAEVICAYHNFQNEDNKAYETSLKAKLKDVEDKLANIMKAIEAGVFNSTTAERMNVLENEKNMLKDAIIEEQNRNQFHLTSHQVRRFLDGFIGDAGNPEMRDKLLRILIHKIYIYPDKMAIVCFFSGDTREFKYEEMERLFENERQMREMPEKASNEPHELSPKLKKLLYTMAESFMIKDDDENEDNSNDKDEDNKEPDFFQ
ncbi:MAG: recombinase family protein [Clostridia bacterium]|nr:recombinase family protein [Clostridia bacterium]